MHVTIEFDIRSERIAEQFVAAIESSFGSGYWLAGAKVKAGKERTNRDDPAYADPKLYDDHFVIELRLQERYERRTRYEIRPSDVAAGLRKMAQSHPMHFADLIRDEGDAITADIFLQLCAFGEIVYN